MDPSISRPVARTTGLLYLAMALVGMPAFLVVRPTVFDTDAATTAAQLVDHETIARLGIGLELALVIIQTLAALWFFRLFRSVDSFAAGAVAVFGTVNAVAILGSAAGWGAALDAATAGDPGAAQLMSLLSANLWAAGAVFFGLWLVPMGLLTLRAGLPRALGWILVAGGVGYVASSFVGYLAPGAGLAAEILTFPATIGEFWMIALLLWVGFRRAPAASPATAAARRQAPVEL